jgi:hypothetical protein
LGRAIEEIEEPSRIAEVETSRTATLAHQLAEHLRLPDVSVHSIVARLDEIQIQLTQLIAKEQISAPQAALAAVTEDPDGVFVIMPFAEKHVDTYDAIRRSVARASTRLRADRIDEVPGAIQITDEVRKAIRKAWLIICDLTEERPNVYYELGLAHGLAKQVICVARKGTTVHFDVYGLKTLFFDTYRSLEDQLEQEVRAMLERAR